MISTLTVLEAHKALGLPTDEETINKVWNDLLEESAQLATQLEAPMRAQWRKDNPDQARIIPGEVKMMFMKRANMQADEIILEQHFWEPIRALRMQRMDEGEELD